MTLRLVAPVALSVLLIISAVPVHADQEVRFRSGPIELAGTIRLPAGSGPFPAAVLVPGSGPETRADLQGDADVLLGLGVAVLSYDKRGCGASGGDWTEASLENLADDAAAAAAELRRSPGIDATRVGLWGVSQGGWVVPLVVARSGPLAFAIAITGGGATPLEVEWYGYQTSFRGAGLSPADFAEVSALIDRYFAYLRCGRARPELVAAVEQAKSRPWYPLAPLGRILPSDESRPAWEWVAAFDPGPSIAALRLPVLVLLGGRDEMSPAELAARRWREGLAQSDRRQQVEVLPEAGHALRIGDHRGGRISEAYAPILKT